MIQEINVRSQTPRFFERLLSPPNCSGLPNVDCFPAKFGIRTIIAGWVHATASNTVDEINLSIDPKSSGIDELIFHTNSKIRPDVWEKRVSSDDTVGGIKLS